MEKTAKRDVCGLLVPETSEDSVDIYDDLDVGISSTADTAKSPVGGLQVKESMDLYEELVTEEEQNKEASYTELKSRFQAAQNQIQELHWRLEQMEMQNTGLTRENCCLKKNISVLLQTARLEVKRKDAEILRLNQRSEKACYRPQPRINLRDPNQSSASSTVSTLSRPPPPAPPPPPTSPPLPAPPVPAVPRRQDQPPRNPSPPSRRESNELPRSSKTFSHSHSKRDHEVADVQTVSDKHKSKCREEKHQSEKLSESTDKRHRKYSDPSKDYHSPEVNRSHRVEGRRYDPKSSQSRSANEEHSKSEGTKTSLSESSHRCDKRDNSGERRPEKGKIAPSEPDHAPLQRSKERHNQEREERKNRPSDKHRSSNSKEQKKVIHHAERHRDSSKERGGDRYKNHQRKEDRRHEEKSDRKHKRSSQSDMSKEREKRRTAELNEGKVIVCGKETQEKSHEEIKLSSGKPAAVEKTNGDENNPNRKLSFMETLNLTLSPIKKPRLSVDGSQEDLTPVDEDARKTSSHDSSQPNLEDMCVIDELENSECEAGSGEVVNESPDSPNVTCSEKTQETSDSKNGAEKQNRSEIIHNTSDPSQSLDTTHTQAVVNLSPTSAESTSCTAVDGSQSHQDTVELVADSRPAEAPHAWTEPRKLLESISKRPINNDLQRIDLHVLTGSSAATRETVVLDSSAKLPKTAAPQRTSLDLPCDRSVSSAPTETDIAEDKSNKTSPGGLRSPPVVVSQPQPGLLAPSTSVPEEEKERSGRPDRSNDADAVSSTISLESLPQEGLSLTEAIYVLTQSEGDAAAEPSSSTGCVGVSAVSSTTEEKLLPGRCSSLAVTPKKIFSPGKKHKNNMEPSSLVPLICDEDSMMGTLSSLKRIPDAISPLRSPIQISKRHLSHLHCKPGHVKSLQKEFPSAPIDANSKKLDTNKENKHPGSPADHDVFSLVENMSSAPSDTDLEEGEILSEGDEQVAGSPAPPTKRPKPAKAVRNKASLKSVFQRKSEERAVASKETPETAGASTRSPRGRFKTVCPVETKASFSSTEEVMETFKVVRGEIRKKYMKLHKSFPKKSFYGVMENFQESFLEFVDSAYFGQICSQAKDLKLKLKKLITSMFGKVSNNGIVKRIFEQQAVDMKQKLWDFVDAQVHYLFRKIETTLKGTCKPSQVEAKGTRKDEKLCNQSHTKKPPSQWKEASSDSLGLNQKRLCTYKTGLGSRGKDIRITHGENEKGLNLHPPNGQSTHSIVKVLPPKNLLLTPEKNNMSSLVVSQNGQLVDKTDFQLLTEQQTSSLTFNLVRDSQMGEIFKCLLQGSDLLEGGGDNAAWTLSTPRKDGERFISVSTPSKFESPSRLLSPTKFETPSKLVATWASILPREVSSPRLKNQVPLNPALFDESCLLEVPSENSVPSQKTYSILAEDLAVSLTIPSPLKSDGHLSFLQPSSMGMHVMSTPDSVISAHISEDALMDGEDATEQDIHLALDTDNSSCNLSSSSSGTSSPLASPFVLKPDMPMQALVLEKSNDHFILKIRQGNTSRRTEEGNCSRTLTEETQLKEQDMVARPRQSNTGCEEKFQDRATVSDTVPPDQDLSNHPEHSQISLTDTKSKSCLTHSERSAQIESLSHIKDTIQENTSKGCLSNKSATNLPEAALVHNHLNDGPQSSVDCTVVVEDGSTGQREENKPQECESETVTHEKTSGPCKAAESDTPLPRPHGDSDTDQQSRPSQSQVPDSEGNKVDVSESDRSCTVTEDTSSSPKKADKDRHKSRKRKKHLKKSKSKRSKKEERETQRVPIPNVKKDVEESRSSQASLSPNSLSAKNVIRKKGEVVIAWTREEDRAILVSLKTKGASRDTFSALSEKLQKPSEQIAHRFHQLMKLFKKMDP